MDKKKKNIPLTPLSAAAKEGKHETVAYLLSLPNVTPEGVKPSELQVCFCNMPVDKRIGISQICIYIDYTHIK